MPATSHEGQRSGLPPGWAARAGLPPGRTGLPPAARHFRAPPVPTDGLAVARRPLPAGGGSRGRGTEGAREAGHVRWGEAAPKLLPAAKGAGPERPPWRPVLPPAAVGLKARPRALSGPARGVPGVPGASLCAAVTNSTRVSASCCSLVSCALPESQGRCSGGRVAEGARLLR